MGEFTALINFWYTNGMIQNNDKLLIIWIKNIVDHIFKWVRSGIVAVQGNTRDHKGGDETYWIRKWYYRVYVLEIFCENISPVCGNIRDQNEALDTPCLRKEYLGDEKRRWKKRTSGEKVFLIVWDITRDQN